MNEVRIIGGIYKGLIGYIVNRRSTSYGVIYSVQIANVGIVDIASALIESIEEVYD